MAWLRTRSLARVFPLALATLATACATEADGTSSGDEGSTATGDGGGATTTTADGGGTTVTTTTGSGGAGQGGGNLQDYPLETEQNDSLATADALATDTLGFTASITSVNDIDVFKVDAAVGSSMRVAISDGNGGCPADANVSVQIYDPSNAELAIKQGLCPELDGNGVAALGSLPAAGTYFVRVTASAPVSQYVVEISVANPVCGDGIVQVGEQCDDTNTAQGDGCENDCTVTPFCGDGSVQTGEACDDMNIADSDGCSSTCQIEGNFCNETEMNGTPGTATSVATCIGGFGQITPIGDLDYFKIDVTVAGSSIRAETVGITGTGCPTGADTVIRLYDSALTEVGSDDEDGAVGNCSLINPVTDAFARNLPIGTYYVSVEDWLNNGTTPPYVLLLEANAPGCGDGIVGGTEQCDDGNLIDGDGCSSTCLLLTCAVGEVSVTLDATDLPQTIADNMPTAPAQSNIVVAQTGTVTKLAVRLNVAHAWMGDTEISLTPPGAATVMLADNIGSSADDMIDTVLSSLGVTNITAGSPPWMGVWQPQMSFSPVIGTAANGTWTLTALDNLGGISGTLTGFSLYMCVQP